MELESDFEAGVRARKALIRRTLYRAGGVVLLLAALIVAYVFYFDFTQRTKYRADTNVAALIDLPDGSSVRLEPSGRLVHAKGMLAAGTGMQRWVDLQGSADFVVRNPDLANFSVITRHAQINVHPNPIARFRIEQLEDVTRVLVQEASVVVFPIAGAGENADQPLHVVGAGQSARVVGARVIMETAPIARP
jgi:ferric-dicitrate binding protein FerR (iron transport regulator)